MIKPHKIGQQPYISFVNHHIACGSILISRLVVIDLVGFKLPGEFWVLDDTFDLFGVHLPCHWYSDDQEKRGQKNAGGHNGHNGWRIRVPVIGTFGSGSQTPGCWVGILLHHSDYPGIELTALLMVKKTLRYSKVFSTTTNTTIPYSDIIMESGIKD